MNISIGCDHAGFPLKGPVIAALKSMGHVVVDCGSYDTTPVDFPDITHRVCEDVLNGKSNKGIMVCGTGVGAAIASNKIPGIRAAVCHDIYSSHQCVEHDDVNIFCIGAQIVGPTLAIELVSSFLNAKFSGEEEFKRRIEKLNDLEKAMANL